MAQHESHLAQFAMSASGDVDPETGHIAVWPTLTHLPCGAEVAGGPENLAVRGDWIFHALYNHRCPDA